jgi:DHA2 family metal-tetracycline-proton antiporter-like MFS transporter
MSTEATMTGGIAGSAEARKTFAVCFAALVATSFCFILRAFSIDAWGVEFGLSETQKGELAGVGLWPFAISIVLLSLIIDRIGFKMTLWFAAACHVVGLVLILQANGYWSLYWGTFVLSLGNGAVEAGINPLIAREFRHDKVTWLNRLHAGWPAGFVLGGILAMLFPAVMGWRYQMALILIPVITYIVMLLPRKFPASERVAAGVSYREMLAEAGFLSAFVVALLMVFEVSRVFGLGDGIKWGLIAVLTIGYGLWSRSPGKPLFIVMILVMIPLAITELGTDSWITSILTPAMTDLGANAGWVLVYAMAIVLVLRLFAGAIVHRISPLGLLAVSALVAIAGLLLLSTSKTAGAIVLAATVYSFGKAFFWPTSLGVVAEQSPRGGAITLNVVAGIGMLGAGVIGGPLIGKVLDGQMVHGVEVYDAKNNTQLVQTLEVDRTGIFGDYKAIDPVKRGTLTGDDKAAVDAAERESKHDALRKIAILPGIMFLVYLGLILYFRSKGGYKPVVLDLKSSE